MDNPVFTRRQVLCGASALAVARAAPALGNVVRRPVSESGVTIPAIGMGTWQTFDVDPGAPRFQVRKQVLQRFLATGGTLIDSSPMYGRAEDVVGRILADLPKSNEFSASKIWKMRGADGADAFETSRALWQTARFDLMQVHNMLAWEAHLDTLLALREQQRVRYIGMTTSHGRRHNELLQVIRTRPEIDTVQFTYNVTHRDAERRLLPTALDHGKGVIINRPFDGGRLPRKLAGEALPDFAAEIGCTSWAALCLKFVIAHPAVTCAIPATTRVDHMTQNMEALRGPLPDADLRRRIVQAVENA